MERETNIENEVLVEEPKVEEAAVVTEPAAETTEKSTDKKRTFNNNRGGNHNRGSGFKGRPGFQRRTPEKTDDFESMILSFRRVSKTTTGGRSMRFSVLTVVGDKKGHIGIGSGKSKETFDARKKAEAKARKNIIKVPMFENRTISHDIQEKFGAVTIKLRQAYKGRGVAARGTARKIFEFAGIKDVVCKCIGNHSSAYAVSYCLLKCFNNLQTLYGVANRTGQKVSKILERSKTCR